MTDLTKASEALLADLHDPQYHFRQHRCQAFGDVQPCACGVATRLLAIEAAVRSDTLADVAARLPDALHGDIARCYAEDHLYDAARCEPMAAAILAHLTGGTDR